MIVTSLSLRVASVLAAVGALAACASSPAHAAPGHEGQRKDGQNKGDRVVISDRIIDINDAISLGVVKQAQAKLLDYDSQGHDPIWIRINSPGGSVDAGLILIDTMKAIESPINCIVESKAYSMAAIILTYCDGRYGYPHATYMLHEASYGTVGDDPSNRSKLDFLTKYLDGVHVEIAKNIGMDPKVYRARIRDAWWLLSDEALKIGLIQKVITQMAQMEFPVEKTEVKRTVTSGAELDTIAEPAKIPKRRE
jgi:ATP-dependent Clp protease protease subunit